MYGVGLVGSNATAIESQSIEGAGEVGSLLGMVAFFGCCDVAGRERFCAGIEGVVDVSTSCRGVWGQM